MATELASARAAYKRAFKAFWVYERAGEIAPVEIDAALVDASLRYAKAMDAIAEAQDVPTGDLL